MTSNRYYITSTLRNFSPLPQIAGLVGLSWYIIQITDWEKSLKNFMIFAEVDDECSERKDCMEYYVKFREKR